MMRGTRILFVAVGAVAAAGLFVELAASAASFSATSSGSSSASASANSSTKAPAASSAKRAEVAAALLALAAGGNTVGGPGTFRSADEDETRIYDALTSAPDVCVTVRNLSRGEIRVSSTGANSIDVEAGETRAACYAAPPRIDLACREGAVCEGVWRVDRQ